MSNIQEQRQDVNTLVEYDDDTLATMADELAKEAERLGRLARGAHAELEQRMRDRGATKMETPHWSGKMTPGPITHTVDDLLRFLQRLERHISYGDLNAAFLQPPLPPMHVDHRQINELHKRGGEIAVIIDEERTSVRGQDRLALNRKPESEAKPENNPAAAQKKKQPTWPGLHVYGGP